MFKNDVNMGNAKVKVHPEKEFPLRDEDNEIFDVEEDDNGFVINNVVINEDVLIAILKQLSVHTILNVRPVCKSWCNVIDSKVWREKLLTSKYKDIPKLRTLPWHLLFVIMHREVLGRNFIKNPCGKEGLKRWTIRNNGGDKFIIEEPPQGVTSGEPPASTCFATSYHNCCKDQIIDLFEEGAIPVIMKLLKPKLVASEWYAGRWDCRAKYEIEVTLLDNDLSCLDQVQKTYNCGGNHGSEWRQTELAFQNFSSTVRFVRFHHSGVDEQFWAGHYGCKMTCASVQLFVTDDSASS